MQEHVNAAVDRRSDLEQAEAEWGWKIYDVNVAWAPLVETYRGSFAQEISSIGIDGFIAKLRKKTRRACAAAHGEKNATVAAYSHMELASEKKRALQYLADRVDSLVSGAKVAPLLAA